MSNYTKSTDFASKDTLPSGDSAKIVRGTEIDAEFEAIETAVNSKYDSSSTIAVANGGTGSTTAAGARTNLGLVIGTDVQAYDADLSTWAGKTAPSGTVVGTSDTQTLTNKTLTSPTLTTPTIDSAQFATVSGTAPIYPCRAWVNFNGTGTVAIRASGNVSSITDNATGDYTVNFTTALSDANYSAIATCSTDAAAIRTAQTWTSATMTTTACKIYVATTATTTATDAGVVTFAVFR
jgi:hypothetical protein